MSSGTFNLNSNQSIDQYQQETSLTQTDCPSASEPHTHTHTHTLSLSLSLKLARSHQMAETQLNWTGRSPGRVHLSTVPLVSLFTQTKSEKCINFPFSVKLKNEKYNGFTVTGLLIVTLQMAQYTVEIYDNFSSNTECKVVNWNCKTENSCNQRRLSDIAMRGTSFAHRACYEPRHDQNFTKIFYFGARASIPRGSSGRIVKNISVVRVLSGLDPQNNFGANTCRSQYRTPEWSI